MDIGLFLGASGKEEPDNVATVLQHIEGIGVASIWVPEHVVLVDEYTSAYPYSPTGKLPMPSTVGIPDPLVFLSFAAAVTKKMRLGTGILLAPQRNVIYTAKETATLDRLSGGRLDLGIGIGWLREEFNALGVDFDTRATRMRDYAGALKSLWCDEVSEYEGAIYSLPPVRCYPKPLQQPHPPVFYGGHSKPALRRVAEFGQGWYGFDLSVDQTRECIETLTTLLDAHGRTLDDITLYIGPGMKMTKGLDTLKEFRDLGVAQVILLAMVPLNKPDAAKKTLDGFAAQFVTPAADL